MQIEPKDIACDTLSITEAALKLGVNRHTLYRAARRGELGALRVGHRLLIPRRTLMRLLDDQ